jgi:nucleoside-diphosphate-sugar epimerase
MKILLTGSSGFLGRALAIALQAEGHQLVLPLRRRVGSEPDTQHPVIQSLEAMTIEDWRAPLKGCDAVIHCAAIAHIGVGRSETDYVAVNAHASGVLAAAAQEEGCRSFVFISSIRAQVGATSPDIQSERTLEAPSEAYGRSKLEGEKRVLESFPTAIILRPALIVGPEPKANLQLLVRLSALPVPLPFASLQKPQAMVSVASVQEAIRCALVTNDMRGQTYVLADGPTPNLAQMIGWIREGQGRPSWLFSLPEPLLRLPFLLIGKGAYFDRLVGGLDVDATRLEKAGWQQACAPADTFRALGRDAR